MGFGFNLFFIFVLVPLTVIFLLIWFISKKKIYGKILLFIWAGIIGLVIVGVIVQKLTSKILLKKDDFYGQYIIDRAKFSGKQADWQYDNFRFEIKTNDSIYFYVTNKDKVSRIFMGIITTLEPYKSKRLVINMKQPTHHILATHPTIYRDTWTFYLVFNSPKFGNVFFTKGQWKSIDK